MQIYPLEITFGHYLTSDIQFSVTFFKLCHIVPYRSINNDVNMNSKNFIKVSVHLSSSIFEIASISAQRSYAVKVCFTGNTDRWLHSTQSHSVVPSPEVISSCDRAGCRAGVQTCKAVLGMTLWISFIKITAPFNQNPNWTPLSLNNYVNK